MTAPESPDTPLCAPVAAVEGASGVTEPANACEQPGVIADGFGSEWHRCAHPLCDLQVVRPGKCQCSDWCDFVPDEDGWPEAHLWVSEAHVAKLVKEVQFAWKLYGQAMRYEGDT